MKGSSFGTQPVGCTDEEVKLFSLLANVERWRGSKVPDKVGTLRLKQAVTLEPMEEHLVWARLKGVQNISAGSAVVIEPTQARSRPRNILVGRTVAILRNDGWLPVKIVNPLPRPVVLRRNTKVADAFPCMALEDFDSGGLLSYWPTPAARPRMLTDRQATTTKYQKKERKKSTGDAEGARFSRAAHRKVAPPADAPVRGNSVSGSACRPDRMTQQQQTEHQQQQQQHPLHRPVKAQLAYLRVEDLVLGSFGPAIQSAGPGTVVEFSLLFISGLLLPHSWLPSFSLSSSTSSGSIDQLFSLFLSALSLYSYSKPDRMTQQQQTEHQQQQQQHPLHR
ncbi:hypothetical protein N1851_006949 [Merluccius polli]|uniref:Uncharacterized protein n=1 Tax=Merluccius polli TaxID=89951 RepID=A0AA47N4V3_MERPO|nr:hypothetical protein N1851_006949 [Merluccius polli]